MISFIRTAFHKWAIKTPVNFPLCRILASHWKRGRGISSLKVYYIFIRLESSMFLQTTRHNSLTDYLTSVLPHLFSLMFLKIKICHHDSDNLMPTLSSPPKYTHFSLSLTARKKKRTTLLSQSLLVFFNFFIYRCTYFFSVHPIKI